MHVRRLVKDPKILDSDTHWNGGVLPARHAPIYLEDRVTGAGWEWRSAKAVSQKAEYILLAQCHTLKDDWKAWLLIMTSSMASVVTRFEHHGNHPGLHVHADCSRSGIQLGPAGLDRLDRIPRRPKFHRRSSTWTKASFWETAKEFFRIIDRPDALP